MILEDVRMFIDIQTIFRRDMTYDTLKAVLMDLVQRTTDVLIPMDISAFSPAAPVMPWAPWSQPAIPLHVLHRFFLMLELNKLLLLPPPQRHTLRRHFGTASPQFLASRASTPLAKAAKEQRWAKAAAKGAKA